MPDSSGFGVCGISLECAAFLSGRMLCAGVAGVEQAGSGSTPATPTGADRIP